MQMFNVSEYNAGGFRDCSLKALNKWSFPITPAIFWRDGDHFVFEFLHFIRVEQVKPRQPGFNVLILSLLRRGIASRRARSIQTKHNGYRVWMRTWIGRC